MALKVLMLKRKLQDKQTKMKELREKAKSFETREKDLEKSIEEAQTEEEKEVVEKAVEEFEKDKGESETETTNLEKEIIDIEKEIADVESQAPKETPAAEERKEKAHMVVRGKFYGMTIEQRDAFFAKEEVKGFLERTRQLSAQKRSVSGAELLLPDEMLDLLKETTVKYSKLISKVKLKPVKGKARQPIMGTVPEAIWTEMEGVLNELELKFNQAEADGYKVGGFIAIANSALGDDVSLATEVIEGLGQAIGYALDKAIVYGKGTKQPLGIITRLKQTEKPSDYPANMRAWEDLHTKNIVKINESSNQGVWEKIVLHSGCAKSKYSTGMNAKISVMNEKTFTTLLSKLITFNVSGMQVAQLSNKMPIISGEIIVLDFMADGDLLYGYGDLYLLAEREGTSLGQSEHAQFIEDNTVFKGIARYDGLPVIAEGFVLMNISNIDPKTTVEFAEDIANTEIGELAVTSEASAATDGNTVITVAEDKADGNTYKYLLTSNPDCIPVYGKRLGANWIAWNGTAEIAAITGQFICVAECKSGKVIKAGATTVTVK